MINEISRYIPDQLYNFITSQRCCQQFCGSFRSEERIIFSEYATELGFCTRNYVKNGIETVKVYKRNCLHYLEAEHLRMQRQSAKELFVLFHTHLHNDFIGTVQEMQVSPKFFSPGSSSLPVVAPYRFSLGAFKQSMARQSHAERESFSFMEMMIPYRKMFLDAVGRSRVLVVNGDLHFQKSITLPFIIFDDCVEKRRHCKIICVELDPMLVVYNAEYLSKNLGEKVGEKVAYQTYGQSRISETSNIIYTTADFLLRVLMGQKIVDSWHLVSHIVLNDVHLRKANIDLLLSELRTALHYYPQLRVLLLSNSRQNSIFLEYFNEGEELQLGNRLNEENKSTLLPQIFYIEEIRQVVKENCDKSLAYSAPPSVVRDFDYNKKYMDRCLDAYEQTGTEQSLDAFLYMVCGEFSCINYRHSVSGRTALIIAAMLGKSAHVRLLLQLHVDPYVLDEQNQNALQRAVATGNAECIDLLSLYCKTIGTSAMDADPASFDSVLVSDLICLITVHPEWTDGNILVFVPNYEQLLRINFLLLRFKVIGKLPHQVIIRVLHDNMEKEQVDDLLEETTNKIKVIITTEIGEFFPYLKNIKYVIDSGRASYKLYNAAADCNDNMFKWNSQECIDNRSLVINRFANITGICFRLLPRSLYSQLPPVNTPDLLTMSLERVCLTVKLLSPHTMIAEYLQRTIARPPFIHVHQTVEYLKKLDILDQLEDITWLGCRLIDLPLDCHLGKALVFGIMLHCFDPVLTIVSFLSQKDPLELPKEMECVTTGQVNTIRYKIKEERKRLSENHFSDHLMYLRLYQEWQNGIQDDDVNTSLVDEHNFVIKALLENIALTRANLVGALRSAQLIHNIGPLNMHSINSNSSNWPLIKAALVGGLYPKVCVVDASVYRIKSGRNKQLVLYPSSVLRDLPLEPLNVSVQKFSSPWIIYSNEFNTVPCNSIEKCSLIAPLAIVLLAGPSKICSENVTTYKAGEYFPRGAERGSLSADSLVSNFYIDEWIWFTMDATDAQLVLKTRQLFYSIYIHYLQNCGGMDKLRGPNLLVTQLPRLLEALSRVFYHEDVAYGFTQPERVGDRPKAKPIKFLQTHNSVIGSCNLSPNVAYSPKTMEKQYFIVHVPENIEADYGKCKYEWLHSAVVKVVSPELSTDKLTYVITYMRNPDRFRSVEVAYFSAEEFKLRECFRNKIPIFDLINICLKHAIHLPSFNERRLAFRIDNQVGEIILDLFAYRDNWICNP